MLAERRVILIALIVGLGLFFVHASLSIFLTPEKTVFGNLLIEDPKQIVLLILIHLTLFLFFGLVLTKYAIKQVIGKEEILNKNRFFQNLLTMVFDCVIVHEN